MVDWGKLYDPDLLSEIDVGLVLHLDPTQLVKEGATCTVDSDIRVEGQHFFLCVEKSILVSKWIPLFTSNGPGRIALNNSGLKGHPKWVATKPHYHPAQIWTATNEAVAHAAARAHDKSRNGSRNTVPLADVPTIV